MNRPTALGAPPSLQELCEGGAIALFLDFDGTLVELAATPDSIAVPDGLSSGLVRLSERLGGRLALISGRAIVDLDRHLEIMDVARAGSHGIHRLTADGSTLGEQAQPLPEEVRAALSTFAARSGVDLEEKSHGTALHFRRMPEREDAVKAFAQELAQQHGLWVKHGKSIAEVVHPGAHKGTAVEAFMETAPFAGARPVFLGDDVTDEDGFAAAAVLGGFGIMVGDRLPTSAAYRLADTASVLSWLGL